MWFPLACSLVVQQTCGRLIPTGHFGAGHRSRYQTGHCGAGHRSGYQSGHRAAGHRSGYQSGHRGAGHRSGYQSGHRGPGHRSGYQSGHRGPGHRSGYQSGYRAAGHRSRAFAQRKVSAAPLAIAETVACGPVAPWITPPPLLCTWSRWCAQGSGLLRLCLNWDQSNFCMMAPRLGRRGC